MPRTSSHSVRHDAVPRGRAVAAAEAWVAGLRSGHPEIVRVGYFGSYARGDYVPGSDFDVMIEVNRDDLPEMRHRADPYLPERFPLGLNVFVYSTRELAELRSNADGFVRAIDQEIQWIA